MPGPDEQEKLCLKTMQSWEDQGLQNPSKLGPGKGGAKEVEVKGDSSRGQEPAAKNMTLDRSNGEVEVVA